MDHPSKPYPNPNVTTTYPAQSYPSQTYAQQAYPSTAGGASTYTTTTVQQSRTVLVRPYFDVNYLRTLPGLLKIIELILMLIAFILAASAWSSTSWYCGTSTYCYYTYAASSAGWTKFVTITGFIITLILLQLYLFHLIERFYSVPWLQLEMIYCAVVAVLLLIAGATMINYSAIDGTRGACVFFCWAAMIVYAFDAFLKFKSFRNGELAQGLP
ncbi:hypothetical protein RvY_17815-2 [Ramazzottius varieornatus]|uniref:MARVEL domain-containing protein n=1 Tax=Ramazzottius varieornatus TaxID=947166 RepID=A0A1D1W448_RAMVA|nr:hypothetical protein RvY_17815-2 [Ramazzottius varieornatus]